MIFMVLFVASLFANVIANDRPVEEVHEHHHRHRPGPGFMLPLRVDIGAAGENTMRGFAGGVGGSIGIHWASLSPGPTKLDVGVGVFGERFGHFPRYIIGGTLAPGMTAQCLRP